MSTSYSTRRGELEHYFDRTVVDAWKCLMSDASVGRICAMVCADRNHIHNTLLS